MIEDPHNEAAEARCAGSDPAAAVAGSVNQLKNNPPIGGRALEALRAVDLYPLGMRRWAHPNAMPMLVGLGYVVERRAEWEGARRCEMGWFITLAGQQQLHVQETADFG